ncbi:MAG: 2'-5' RNA ligase family protein, partial [Oscillospiraceae bacterium]|nr:2'-5' RNA ligase family protein [Oscillospiraceae bacterium]
MAQKSRFITVMAIFDEETQRKMLALSEAFAAAYGPDLKTGSIPYHITLGSYAVEDTDEIVGRIIRVAKEAKALDVKFSGLDSFGNVVWLMEPEISDELMALHLQFDSDYANGYPGWRPHATIYRSGAPVEAAFPAEI